MKNEDKSKPENVITIGTYEARTRFSELVARTEKGESFLVTKNGRPVARITPANNVDRERAQKAAERLRALLATQGPPVSEQDAQRNWDELKRELEVEDDEGMDRWASSSMPR
jgi:prevent-host-death family protein